MTVQDDIKASADATVAVIAQNLAIINKLAAVNASLAAAAAGLVVAPVAPAAPAAQ